MKCKCNLQKVWAYPETLCLALGSSIIFLKPSCTHKNTNRIPHAYLTALTSSFLLPPSFFIMFWVICAQIRRCGSSCEAAINSDAPCGSQCEKRTNPLERRCGIDVAWQDSRPARSDLKGTPTKMLLGIEPSFNRTRGSEWAKKDLFHFINQWFRLHWITQEQTVALTRRSCWEKNRTSLSLSCSPKKRDFTCFDKIYVYRIKACCAHPLIPLF